MRIGEFNSTSPLFDDDGMKFNDIKQGGAGTCYILAALGAMAEYPSLIESMFVDGIQLSENGIYNIRFYIRGKPWVVTIDDYMLVNSFNDPNVLVFTQPDPVSGAMWSALIEKAWAKVAGNYELANGGYLENALRSLAGVPVFTYWGENIIDDTDAKKMWQLIKAADNLGFITGASVYKTMEGTTNVCGMVQGHAYSVIAAFELIESNGTKHKMYLLRNPWSITYYSSDWHAEDPRWTDDLVSQVPYSIDPRTSRDQGIFTIPYSKIINEECITSLQVGHQRSSEGYNQLWFDQEYVSRDLE